MRKIFFNVAFLLVVFSAGKFIMAQSAVHYVNYGPESEIKEGDDDFVQVIFLVIPEDESGTFTVKLFDIDCGNKYDLTYLVLDSKFRFSIYGGSGVYTAGSITSHHPLKSDLYKGKLIDSIVTVTGNDSQYDDKWIDFVKLTPDQGELVNGYRYFKFLVEGLDGDDANEFDIEAEFDDSGKKIAMINYCPTFRLPPYNKPVRVRFTPETDKITIYNFDGDSGRLKFVTPFRPNIGLTRSYEGQWKEDEINLEDYEVNEVCELEFGPGIDKINDISFYAVDDEGTSLPFRMPIIYPVANKKPVIRKDISLLDDCRTFVYDAGATSDPDNNDLRCYAPSRIG